MHCVRILVTALIVIFAGACLAPAEARYEVCNETSYVARTSLAFKTGEDFTSVGWFTVYPGQCRVLIDQELTQESYFIHARSIAGHRGPMRHWAGDTAFCVDDEDFNIKNDQDCEKSGYAEAYYSEIDVGSAKDWKTTFTEPASLDREKAAILGVQRLLVDLDLLSPNHQDGYWGRNTLRATEAFRRQFSLQVPDEPGPDLFRALVQAVQDRARGKGFEICNKTDVAIWAAIGVPEGGRVATKGWYELHPAACAKPIVNAPPARIFVYAETVDSAEKKAYWSGDGANRLCTNDVMFSVTARSGECAALGLQDTSFRSIETGSKEKSSYDFTIENLDFGQSL